MSLDFKEIAYSGAESKALSQRTVMVDTAKRHVIRINGIEASRKEYKPVSTMRSRELITEPVRGIALFCSEYIPDHFPKSKYITYIFTINGKDHEVEPINSHRQGKKIIRYSSLGNEAGHIEPLKESIKSAYLTIVIRSEGSNETPLLSGMKILYEEEGGDNSAI